MASQRTYAVVVAAVAALALGLTTLPAQAYHEGWDNDCGSGRDTPAAIHIANGQTCGGDTYGEGTYYTYRLEDQYSFSATLDDYITITLAYNNCNTQVYIPNHANFTGYGASGQSNNTKEVSVSFLSKVTGNLDTYIFQPVGPSFSPEPQGYGQDCWYQTPYNYAIRPNVIPNDRPIITSATGPTELLPGASATFAVAASDSDRNLRRVGLRKGAASTYNYIRWTNVGRDSGTGSHTFTFDKSETVYLFAEDSYGAQAVTTIDVVVREDDCATGDDIVTAAVALPFSCDGWLWSPINDLRDSFTFEVPGGAERLYAGFVKPSDSAVSAGLTLHGPSGVAGTSANEALIVPAGESGSWRLDLDLLSGKGGTYETAIRLIGPPAPPAVTASATAVHQGDTSTLSITPTDPNGERVRVTAIDWGDGTTATTRQLGSWADSGETRTFTHRYWKADVSPEITLTVENEEHLATSATVPVSVTLHNDCGLDEGFDAPASRFERDGTREISANGVCSGTLGHGLPASSGTDTDDYYIVSVPAGSTLTVSVDTDPGLTARLWVYQLGVGHWSVIDGRTTDIPLAAGSYAIRVQRTAGAGGYAVSRTSRPLL